jgi:hypothetical protein
MARILQAFDSNSLYIRSSVPTDTSYSGCYQDRSSNSPVRVIACVTTARPPGAAGSSASSQLQRSVHGVTYDPSIDEGVAYSAGEMREVVEETRKRNLRKCCDRIFGARRRVQ